MFKSLTNLAAKYKKTAVGLAVAGAASLGLAMNPELLLFAAEAFDLLEGIARGMAQAGMEAATEAPSE